VPRALLVVGAAASSGRTALRAAGLGLRVVAVVPPAGDPPDRVEAVERADVADRDAITAIARRHGIAGVLASSRDALASVTAAATACGLPGPPEGTVPALTSRIALRRLLAVSGVPQPRFAAVRSLHEGVSALASIDVPALLRPAEPWADDAAFVVRTTADLEAHLFRTLAASASGEAIVETAASGTEVDALCLVRERRVTTLLLADRPAPKTLTYPSTLFADALADAVRAATHAVHVLGIDAGVATVRLRVADGEASVTDAAPWTPDVPLDALCRHAIGVDPLELALRVAVGADMPELLSRPRFQRAAALRIAPADDNARGLVERDRTYLVTAAPTNLEALELAEAAAAR
jgi:biotin carboxylase